MEGEHTENTRTDIGTIAVYTLTDYIKNLQKNYQIQNKYKNTAKETEFLRKNTEDKVRTLLR